MPPPAVTLRLSASTTINGATTPENFKRAVAELDDGLDPYMVRFRLIFTVLRLFYDCFDGFATVLRLIRVYFDEQVEILAWPQALTGQVELPGSVADFGGEGACDPNTCTVRNAIID